MSVRTASWRLGVSGEQEMMQPLIDWLRRTRRAPRGTEIRFELPWRGRRVDLAVLTRSGSLSAFELKYGGFSRVLEQAIYNRLAFDRSWIVVRARPKPENLADAVAHGIGVLQVTDEARVLAYAVEDRKSGAVRARVRDVFARTGGLQVV